MIDYRSREIETGVTRYRPLQNGTPLTFRGWIKGLQQSDAALESFIDALKNSPYEGYFWEVKPITRQQLDDPFEFVLVESGILPGLTTDTSAFREYFQDGSAVKAFANLGGDAQLIVPAQIGDVRHYAHLAAFVRNAPEEQISEFWRTVAAEYERFIGDNVKWLSTAGLGIYWLHVRIDSRPKYYRYGPYKTVNGERC